MELNTITPILLRESAKSWIELYKLGINTKSPSRRNASVYCFFFGFELYLKAYLAAKDAKFCQEKILKENLGHNLSSIYNEIKKVPAANFLVQLEPIYKKYNLFDEKYIDLRYPLTHRGVELDSGLTTGNTECEKIFNLIDSEITKWVQSSRPNLS